MDGLSSFFQEHPFPEEPLTEVTTDASLPPEEQAPPPLSQHRRKEAIYDEEMLRLLAKVKVASKGAVFQHFHQALRGNTSIGAVESYLKRAALRGIIVRLRRGEYTLPPSID